MQHVLLFIFAFMRILLFIFLIVFAFETAIAQQLNDSGNRGPKNADENNSEEEIEEINVESVIRSWQLVNEFSTPKIAIVDTATLGFHNYNPIFRRSISNTYLGYMNSPYESNIFFDRTNNSSFYFLKHFDAYRRTNKEVKYFNTTTPYASLMYEQGAQEGGTQQVFKAFFTQNIDSVSNWGFRFNVSQSPGQYNNQEGRHKFLNVFASRNTERYNAYFSAINASDGMKENGGINDTTLNYFEQYTIPNVMQFSLRAGPGNFVSKYINAMENEQKSFSLFTSHEYLFGKLPFKSDSLLVDSIQQAFIPKYGIQYSVDFENFSRFLIENNVNDNYFENNFISNDENTDSTFLRKF